ncbi:MAG: hypothetical protein HY092_03615 [Candidatus Kerfeldbacteria bacterium]|nr:hypothetical protein [Candidatus Kerfeldbacteria bacterium]
MSRHAALTDRLAPTSYWWHRLHLSTQKFAVLLTLSAFAAGFGYVLLTNNTAALGFQIRDLQKNISHLQASNQKLQLQAADLRSLSLAQQAGQTLQLQPTDRVEYLPVATGTVAVK